jgi:ubiquinone/menaquinone biosynthesis C-methylase UbiE
VRLLHKFVICADIEDVATDFDDFERVMWAGRAAAYERVFAQCTTYTATALLDAAHVTEGCEVLDVGTGPGTVAGAARRRDARVRAVDADAEMVAMAARNVPGLDVQRALMPDLPFPDAAFDAVVANFVINHVGEPDIALAEVRRVLRPGGRLALTAWPAPGSTASRAHAIVNEAMEKAGVVWPADVPLPPFHQYAEPVAFAALVAAAGFADAKVDEVVWEHVVDPEDWWAGPLAGVGGTGYVLTRQAPETIARVRAEYDQMAAAYATADGRISLPARALLAHATR